MPGSRAPEPRRGTFSPIAARVLSADVEVGLKGDSTYPRHHNTMSRPIPFIKRLIHRPPTLQELAPILRDNHPVLHVPEKSVLTRRVPRGGNVRRDLPAGVVSVASLGMLPCRGSLDDTSVARKVVFCRARSVGYGQIRYPGDLHEYVNV